MGGGGLSTHGGGIMLYEVAADCSWAGCSADIVAEQG
jgi:hypothetical protein